MNAKPAYFEPIRQRAADRWQQLDGDPELAGPWHQLFKQVQSPRHIVSELLQNADDAGATEAIVAIENDAFVFRHNGEDFTEEHFASLCRFGYSNKRALHTIGFRGIGFKSTFSLGDRVELYTPSLSIAFHQKHFTEPSWIDGVADKDAYTTIRVAISDEHRKREVEKNLNEWLKSPLSLLFFKNIRHIRVNEKEVHWGSLGAGPVDGTEWLALDNDPDQSYLLARSAPQIFPEEALREIKQERLLSVEQDMDFPPCQVEIVMGAGGRLYVVLPTGVETSLPFSINAPFIQDPARLKIKDPETSPTNRWLLERAGQLAADVMLKWLGRETSSVEDRAGAYGLMPDVNRDDSVLEGVCGAIVEQSFETVIQDKPILLTDDGDLVESNEAILLPRELFDVWPKDQAMALFDEEGRAPLAHAVTNADIDKLKNWNALEEIDHQDILSVLQRKHFPRPGTWAQLLTLWSYVDGLLKSYSYYCTESDLRVVPVQGKDALFAASEVVRLGEKRIVPSEDDWQFLGDRLSVLNQNWMRYLTEQRRLADLNKDKGLHKLVTAADHVLEEIGLNEPSDTGKVIDTVAASFFTEKTVTLVDAIRLAQIAAKLGASIGDNFRYACQDRHLRSIGKTILYDRDGSLSILLPDEWAEKHLLHREYTKTFQSCSKEEWDGWIGSGRSGLAGFVPLKETYRPFWRRKDIDAELMRRGYKGRFEPRYSSPSFRVNDWDFSDEIWDHWELLADDVPGIWAQIAERVLLTPNQWSSQLSAAVSEEASNGHSRRLVRDGLTPSWLMKLREKPCLRDTNNTYRRPDELLMRTPQTEALRDIEPFVHGLLDSEATRSILKLLGVSDQPTGPEKLLARIQALSKSEAAPAHEIEKWYRRLDQLIDGCSTETFLSIKTAFEEERLILSESGIWETTHGVFLFAGEEDIPDVPLIRPAVRDLTLWRKIGVGDRPTAELAIQWLQELPTGTTLSADDTRRVKSLLTRYPTRIWSECGHWLSLAGEWSPVENFSYAMSMQSLTHWSHLHQWVKQKTADLRNLLAETAASEPFSLLAPLAEHIQERFQQRQLEDGWREDRLWLQELGRQIRRIRLDDVDEEARVRALGTLLSHTQWLTSHNIEIIPYIEGKPAGTPRRAEVLWLERTVYAEDRPLAKLAKAVAQELGKVFRRAEIGDAIKLCFDRDSEFVISYMEENFDLAPESEIGEAIEKHGDSESAESTDAGEEESASDFGDEASGSGEEAAEPSDELALIDDSPEDESADDEPSDEKVEGDDEADSDEVADHLEPVAPRKPRPVKPLIMERFALAQGFKKDNDFYYYNDQGSVIGKANGSLFPWELRTSSGDVVKRYWPKEHCLEREPLQLEAEIWGVLEQHPDSYVLILTDADGEPIEVTGKLLTELRERGVLALHPSTYRLVIDHEKQL